MHGGGGGSAGYVVGESITLGGDEAAGWTEPAELTVTSVDENGGITGLSVDDGGQLSAHLSSEGATYSAVSQGIKTGARSREDPMIRLQPEHTCTETEGKG